MVHMVEFGWLKWSSEVATLSVPVATLRPAAWVSLSVAFANPLSDPKQACCSVLVGSTDLLSISTSSSSSCSFYSSSCSYSSLSCLSSWCTGSAVSLTLMLAVLALVLAEAALDFKTKSISLQHFHRQPTLLSQISLSFSPLSPCVTWCLDDFFC